MVAHYAYGEKRLRNHSIYMDRAYGMKYGKIAEKYGITLERVRQIVIKVNRKMKNNHRIHSRMRFRQDIILPEDGARMNRWIGAKYVQD